MRDFAFKHLAHKVGGHRIASRGEEVAKGYKPDLTATDTSDRLVLILESESTTNRKAFLGDLVKAEKYAEECEAHPSLVIVMQVYSNTTVKQIAEHLTPYVDWLARLKNGRLQLSDVLVISDEEYQQSIEANEVIGSDQFSVRGTRAGPLADSRS